MAKYFYSYNVTAAGMGTWFGNDVTEEDLMSTEDIKAFESTLADKEKKRLHEASKIWQPSGTVDPAWVKVTIISFQKL